MRDHRETLSKYAIFFVCFFPLCLCVEFEFQPKTIHCLSRSALDAAQDKALDEVALRQEEDDHWRRQRHARGRHH